MGLPTEFSIIVPCYNCRDFIKDCIDSVVSQTYDSWELVVVDDGSTDGSSALLNELASTLGDRMKVLHQENKGQLLARNFGLQAATADYVLFLDADDALRANTLEQLHAAIANNPGAIFQYKLCRKADFSDKGEPDYPGITVLPRTVEMDWVRRIVCSGPSLNNLCTKAFPKKALLADVDFESLASITYGEDLLRLIPILDGKWQFVLLPDVLYYYRQNTSSITNQYRPERYRCVRTVNCILREHAKTWHDEECVQLLAIRWLNETFRQLGHLRHANLPIHKLSEEIRVIGDDELFRTSWASRSALQPYKRLLLELLWRRKYKAIAALITSVGFLESRLSGRKQ